MTDFYHCTGAAASVNICGTITNWETHKLPAICEKLKYTDAEYSLYADIIFFVNLMDCAKIMIDNVVLLFNEQLVVQ